MLTRRRVLLITAAASLATPAGATTAWTGRALGAEASIKINREGADQALTASLDTIRRMEKLFSLYDPNSALSQLNRHGHLEMPPEFAALIQTADKMVDATNGLFDPTVQPLWDALAKGQNTTPALDLVGWDKVRIQGQSISFEQPGMAMTLNGIAQGFATDRVKAVLASFGFDRVMVNVGEYAVGSDQARLGIADGQGDIIDQVTLKKGAVATSSPRALRLAGGSHVLHPSGSREPSKWNTVSVIAPSATVADAVSTALCLTESERLAHHLTKANVVRQVILKHVNGDQLRIG